MPNPLTRCQSYFKFGFTKLKSRFTDRPNFRFQNKKIPCRRDLSQKKNFQLQRCQNCMKAILL